MHRRCTIPFLGHKIERTFERIEPVALTRTAGKSASV